MTAVTGVTGKDGCDSKSQKQAPPLPIQPSLPSHPPHNPTARRFPRALAGKRVVKKGLRHGQICPLRIKHVEFEPASITCSVLNRVAGSYGRSG